MQQASQISLNAVRVFVSVAEAGSLKRAASALGVTPGAVSRQVLNLEAALGVQLFIRSNNAIHLTETGADFLRHAQSGVHMLHRALDTAMGDGQVITVQVPTTLASRVLIPRLGDFRARWPDITIRVETHDATGIAANTRADVIVAYFPVSEALGDAEILIEDRCRPYLAPTLLARIDDPSAFSRVPALQSTGSNWDWQVWLEATDTPDAELTFGGHFDLDDVALRAAIAGMGMVLASEFMIRDDLDAGRLYPLPDAPEVVLGHYIARTSPYAGLAESRFVRWLKCAF